MNQNKLNRILGILPLVTGLIGMSSIIYMNGVRGIGVGTFWTAGLMTIGIIIFGLMFFTGIAMITNKENSESVQKTKGDENGK